MHPATTLATKHVLIIGGGLAGPCLALSLARHNIRSTIFEIRPFRSDSGGSLSLGPNGLRVLDTYAGVYDRLKTIGFAYNTIGAYTAEGEKLGNIRAGEQDDEGNGYPALRIMRPELHKALLEAVEEKGIEVKYGMKLSRIDEGEDSVTAHFEDGLQATGKPLSLQ
jgi:2-polyprenyl-6-methoxyphenol hydroxylase-like FAD-dependent oxidoreductase